jgi:branched-chain amino acid aminotransferase
MAKIYPSIYLGDRIVPSEEATLHIASSAVLYGLSVYTVFNVHYENNEYRAFRLHDHFNRLLDSCKIIGITTFADEWTEEKFIEVVQQIIRRNDPKESVFIRASVHIDELVPGTRSRGLHSILSLFVYGATPIVPQNGARLKTSVWRRIPDNAIPSRAKVNGAYVNSVLAKQDALDSGYDDCIFLDINGHVCELSAANIFLVRNGVLITPNTTSDLLEGINRRTIIELAKDMAIPVEDRTVDLTELYIADEVFMSGTSAFVAPVINIDGRVIGNNKSGSITTKLQNAHSLSLREPSHKKWLTQL